MNAFCMNPFQYNIGPAFQVRLAYLAEVIEKYESKFPTDWDLHGMFVSSDGLQCIRAYKQDARTRHFGSYYGYNRNRAPTGGGRPFVMSSVPKASGAAPRRSSTTSSSVSA